MQLLLDLDQKFSLCRWMAWCDRAAWVLKEVKVPLAEGDDAALVRETDRGYHVYINVDAHALGDPGRHLLNVLLQSLMGSDWKRETLNAGRILRGEKGWNVLFAESRSFNGKGAGPINIEVPAPKFEAMLRDALRESWRENDGEPGISRERLEDFKAEMRTVGKRSVKGRLK